jgi:hypothetical protein
MAGREGSSGKPKVLNLDNYKTNVIPNFKASPNFNQSLVKSLKDEGEKV